MSNLLKYFILPVLLWQVTILAYAQDNVVVFATSNQEITGIPKTYHRCNLDDLQIIQSHLNDEIAQFTAQDSKKITALVQANSAQLNAAMNCLVQAKYYEIQQLPAMVINHQVIVYGEYDVPAALIAGAPSNKGQE